MIWSMIGYSPPMPARLQSGVRALFAVALACPAMAQDIKLNVTYVCNGERMYVESCNIRDVSDSSKCMVGHPDRPSRNGIMVYTYETRATLKQLFPTCKQPSAKELAAADAFEKKQKQLYDAAVQKANPQPAPAANSAPAAGLGRSFPSAQTPKTPEQRALNRCITSGRLPASCTGNSLLGAFGNMISQVLPSAAQKPATGLAMFGVFQGAGNWRLDFTDESVLVNCSFLSPDDHHYKVEIKNNLALVTIDTTPKPLILTMKPDGTMTAPGPREIDGVVATGTTGGPSSTHYSGYKDQFGRSMSDSEAASHAGPVYDSTGNRVYGAINAGSASYSTFAPRKATCPALNLTSKGGAVGVVQMQTDLLKTAFGGDKGPPTPPGIRMHGIFAASTGFSLQFFPESVILGCGPDAARAYPYSVVADGTKAFLKIDATDHPLNVAFRPDGALDPGTGAYQVHGRVVSGQDNNGDFTFAPYEQTCNLGALAPSKEIPSSGGGPGTMVAAAGVPGTASNNGGGMLSTPDAPLGNATLSIVSGFQAGVPNPLAGRPYVLLRDSYANALAKGGVAVPAGTSAFKYVATVCASKAPDCQQSMNAIKANAASAVRADATGAGTFPGVPPGVYYLMISTRYNNQSLFWGQAVQLKAGSNSLKLDQSNAVPIN